MEAFEPPKYVTSLIAAINDGAKSAQAGALLFLLVGLYLLATAFSASDEDLLLSKTVTISQIGTSLPVSFSFAIAPLVFVFLHIYTLVRYDLLAANVRQFRKELHNTVPLESDRERCRQLLTNVEFIVVLTAPQSSPLYSRLWIWLFRGIAAGFPVAVILLVQINALRYQSDLIMWTQRIWLAVDLVALVWFFRRNALNSSVWPERIGARIRRWAGLLLAPVLIGAVNLFYLNTVPARADPQLVRYNRKDHDNPEEWLPYIAGNPLDLVLCPQLNWGCRFLRVDHRTLVGKVQDEKALGTLRMDVDMSATTTERSSAMAAIEGVFLRNRSFRFAEFSESRLYSADLIDADLRKASLKDTDMSGARLSGALLIGSDLTRSRLIGVQLENADLTSANLNSATLIHGKLFTARMSGAYLADSNLSGADLRGALLNDTYMFHTNLSGANLSSADLENANLDGTNLTSANLDSASLHGAKLFHPDLTGTDLNNADFYGASLYDTDLTKARNISRVSRLLHNP